MKRRMVRVEAERRREEARRAERAAAESSSAAAKYNRAKSRRRRVERRPSIMKIENVSGFLLIVKFRGGWLVYNVGDYLFVFLYITPFVSDQVFFFALFPIRRWWSEGSPLLTNHARTRFVSESSCGDNRARLFLFLGEKRRDKEPFPPCDADL